MELCILQTRVVGVHEKTVVKGELLRRKEGRGGYREGGVREG